MYKLLAKLAWKNSFLRLSRTFLLIVMISVSMSMMLSIQALYDGMAENMLDKNRRSYSGDVSIFAKGYLIDKEIKDIINDADTLTKDLKETPGITSVISRVNVQGLLSTARKSSFITLVGFDLEDEKQFGQFDQFLKSGEMSVEKNSAIIGLELAKKLKVKIGSKVVFSTQDVHGEIVSVAYKIKAIVQTTNIALDAKGMFVDKTKLQKLLGVQNNQVSQISAMVSGEEITKSIQKKYSSYDVKSFMELQPMMQQMQDMMFIFNSITFMIVMSVVFVGIFGVMYVSILDRIREFGIMMSVGYHYKYVRFQVILEAVIVGVLGYVLGAVLGYGMLLYLQHYGLDFTSFSDALEMWGYESIIYGTIKVSYFTTTFVAIVLASLLSVVIPLRKLKKLSLVDIIKVEK